MKQYKVLIIDDDKTTCDLLETVFQMENYQTASAYMIEGTIIPLLEAEQPDILVLDFHLGSEETLQYLDEIRSNTGWSHLPVLMTSALDKSFECLGRGANQFLLKPFDWQDVITSIKEITSKGGESSY